jgi:hypothetical protein
LDPLNSAGFNQCLDSVACFVEWFCPVDLKTADSITHTDQTRLLPFLPNCSLGPPVHVIKRLRKDFPQSTWRGPTEITPIDQKRLTPFCLPRFFVEAPPVYRAVRKRVETILNKNRFDKPLSIEFFHTSRAR